MKKAVFWFSMIAITAFCWIMSGGAPANGSVQQPQKVAVTWYHICLTVSNGSHCITANGVGKDLSIINGTGNKWQAIPEGSDGRIAWQNGSGNCMIVDGSTGGVQAAGSGCAAVSTEEWFVSGNGNLVFNNVNTENDMGTNGDQAGKLVYAHPPHTGFYRGWTTFGCCTKQVKAHLTTMLKRSSPVDISSGSCHNETFTAGIVQESGDDYLRVTWVTNGCGWWIWPRTHCEDPKIGSDAGWSNGGHVESVGVQSGSRPKCFDPNAAIVNLAQWHHHSNSGTTYQIGLSPTIKR
jgi:hypothetical protein